MINLFLDPAYWAGATRMNGPQKLATNLISSLDEQCISFAINEEKYKHNFIVHYDYRGYLKHSELTLKNCFIGPQIWFFDQHVNHIRENPHFYNKLIVPSQWTKNLPVQKFGFSKNKVEVWPVGIELKDYKKDIEYDCLLYYKRRSREELEIAKEFLKRNKLTYSVIEYGSYTQEQLEKLSDQSKFCFLLNGTESQGIAVQEMMARDLPMFVWDVKEWNDQGSAYTVPASSVPYWSDECGAIFYELTDMQYAFDEFCGKIYTPRKFVEQNLSFKVSVDRLLEIFNAD